MAGLYYYFPAKDDLMADLIARIWTAWTS